MEDAEAEAAKRETLATALAAFVAAVRRDREPGEAAAAPSAADLLGPGGKLGLAHIMPIYKECAAELVRARRARGDAGLRRATQRACCASTSALKHALCGLDRRMCGQAEPVLSDGGQVLSKTERRFYRALLPQPCTQSRREMPCSMCRVRASRRGCWRAAARNRARRRTSGCWRSLARGCAPGPPPGAAEQQAPKR